MKTLREALHSQELTLTAELSLAPHHSAAEIVEQARLLGSATDAVQVPDHRHAAPHISNIAVAAHLMQAGIDPIVHMNCRDRNRIAMQSDLLAAHSLGVSNLLLMRGSKLPADHLPRTTDVFDFGAIDLIATAAAIRNGEVFVGEKAPHARDFYIGTVATAFDPPAKWQPEKLTTKADSGAQFIQLQVCFDMDVLRAYLTRLVAAKLTWRFQILVGLAVLPSAEEARLLRKNFPDAMIPGGVVKRLEQTKDAEQEGIRICTELLQELVDVPGIAGTTLMTPGDPATIPAVIRASGLRPDLQS
ncbi:MAG: methylenetetrahydrofolate reductase [Gammaproteobacteria bacterium]|nr:methylenetetrahydrofolate reductase [Gammaproteobacteria bacterium]